MKKMAVVVALLLVLAGGTAGVMSYLGLGPFAEAPDGEAPPPAEHAVETAKPFFVDVEPLVVSVFAGERTVSTIALEIKLEVPDAAKEAELRTLMPRLKDAFLRDLHGAMPRLRTPDGRVDLEAVKRRLLVVAERVAGDGSVSEVLIQSAAEMRR